MDHWCESNTQNPHMVNTDISIRSLNNASIVEVSCRSALVTSLSVTDGKAIGFCGRIQLRSTVKIVWFAAFENKKIRFLEID